MTGTHVLPLFPLPISPSINHVARRYGCHLSSWTPRRVDGQESGFEDLPIVAVAVMLVDERKNELFLAEP